MTYRSVHGSVNDVMMSRVWFSTPSINIDTGSARCIDCALPELLQEIQKEGSKYVRHSQRIAPGQALSTKDSAIPSTVQAHYDEIDKLGQEKERLAERIVQLVMRARSRLDCDLNRILVLQGEADSYMQPGFYPAAIPKNPISQVNEMLRHAPTIAELPSTPTGASTPPLKSACILYSVQTHGSLIVMYCMLFLTLIA
jgi:hypothetical protein